MHNRLIINCTAKIGKPKLNVIAEWFIALRVQIASLGANYALFVNVYLLLHFTIGERFVLIAFLNNAAHWLLLGVFGSVILILISPYHHIWLVYTVPGIVMFFVWYGVLFIPKAKPEIPPEATTIRVATYNVQTITAGFENRVRVMSDIDADIVGLQESSYWYIFSVSAPQYEYQLNMGAFTVLSHYPLIEDETFLIGNRPDRRVPVALRTVADIDGQYISIYVMHPLRPRITVRPLIYDGAERTAGVKDVVWELEDDPNPIIILCDCNMAYRSDDYALLNAHGGGWFGGI